MAAPEDSDADGSKAALAKQLIEAGRQGAGVTSAFEGKDLTGVDLSNHRRRSAKNGDESAKSNGEQALVSADPPARTPKIESTPPVHQIRVAVVGRCGRA